MDRKIDLASKTIQTSLGNCKYDYLIVATGATTNFSGNEILEKNAMPMKSVVEALYSTFLAFTKPRASHPHVRYHFKASVDDFCCSRWRPYRNRAGGGTL